MNNVITHEKWDNYKVGDVKFININKGNLYHEFFIGFIRDNPNIKTVLEIGPGELLEYPYIKKIRPDIKYTVLETSTSFIDYINKTYPEITIYKGIIEKFISIPLKYDLVRICDVLEHTFPVSLAISNLMYCAKNFHITMFKWKTGVNDNSSINDSIMRVDSSGYKYFSTKFPILEIIGEIKKYGTILSAKIVTRSGEVYDFNDHWVKNELSDKLSVSSVRGDRLIITGTRRTTDEVPENEVGPEHYNAFFKRNPKYKSTRHPYIKPIINMMWESKCKFTNILEIGAGFGLASEEIISKFKPESYCGYEFSNAMSGLRERLNQFSTLCNISLINDTFKDIDRMDRFDCVIALEILEHINWDLDFIKKINPGTKVFFSVPTKPNKLHVRHFIDKDSIIKRYSEFLEINSIEFVPHKWHCVYAIRR